MPFTTSLRDENLPLLGGNPLSSSKNKDPRNFRRSVEFFFKGGLGFILPRFSIVDKPSPSKAFIGPPT